MKTVSRLALLLLLAPVPCLWALFESPSVVVTEEPEMPAVLRMNGLSNGQVRLVLDIDAEGKLVDWLVLGASHRELIKPCVVALQNWRYRPARLDGEPVLGQLLLTIGLSQTGAVVSRTATDTLSDWVERIVGRQPDYQTCPADEVDRPLVPIATVTPHYPADAEKVGVRGRVKVYFYVDEQGAVRMPAVPAEAHPYLSYVAIRALREWKFEPPTSHGRPVLVAAAQEFNFGEDR